MTSVWFPRPQAEEDVEVVSLPGRPARYTAAELVQLLNHPQSQEWRHKVGVASPRDGSAKITTRLLWSQGVVFKTDQARRRLNRAEAQSELETAASLAQKVAVWHPEKEFFVLYSDPWYWTVTACPELLTLRRLPTREARLAAWTRMLTLGLRMSQREQVGLDLNPSNFGLESEAAETLFYLDDEIYPTLSPDDIGAAIAARIPEEPGAEPAMWQAWGAALQASLKEWLLEREDWAKLAEGVQNYLLTGLFQDRRAAVLAGLSLGNPALDATARRKAREDAERVGRLESSQAVVLPPPARTCIFSDVHGNLPALEAVLAAAKLFGVDDYLFLGDVVGYGPFPRECIDRLRRLPRCTRLLGNHDQMAAEDGPLDGINRFARQSLVWTREQLSAEERSWLLAAPLDHTGPGWLAVHGAPVDSQRCQAYVYELTYKDNLAWLVGNQVALCFYGHTHVQFVYRQWEDGRVEQMTPSEVKVLGRGMTHLINPGSVGQPRDGDPAAAFAIWDRITNLITFHRAEYPVVLTATEIGRVGLPSDLAVRLEIGR